jgi:3-hydroxy-9,10-secoandrosta-1,3,5(10)-triene-9,17-dione monooxygenase
MKDAGFFKILQPKQYGGYELDPHTFSEVQLRVAQGCMSTAWVFGCRWHPSISISLIR